MARHGNTTKPCHGCGSTAEHPRDRLCPECMCKFENAKDYNKLVEELQTDERIAVRVPSGRNHPSFLSTRLHTQDYNYEAIGRILASLAKDISIDTPKLYTHYWFVNDYDKPMGHGSSVKTDITLFIEDGGSTEHTKIVIMNKATYELLDSLYKEIKKELKLREDSGFNYGKNLLMQLNNNEILASDFIEKAK